MAKFKKYVELKAINKFLAHVDFSEFPVSPCDISEELEECDCDDCANERGGELFNNDVCVDCWKRAFEEYSIGFAELG